MRISQTLWQKSVLWSWEKINFQYGKIFPENLPFQWYTITILMYSIFQDQEGLKRHYLEFSENRDFLNFSRFFETQIFVISSQLSQNIFIYINRDLVALLIAFCFIKIGWEISPHQCCKRPWFLTRISLLHESLIDTWPRYF